MQTVTTPETLVLAASRTLTLPQVSGFTGEAIPGLEADAQAQGLTFTGPWIFVSHNLPQDATTTFSLRICRAVEPAGDYAGEYAIETLPSLTCATLDYRGPLQGIFAEGYAPLLEQVLQSGIPLTGEIREVYHVWTDPTSPDNHVQIQVGISELPEDGNPDSSAHVPIDVSSTD